MQGYVYDLLEAMQEEFELEVDDAKAVGKKGKKDEDRKRSHVQGKAGVAGEFAVERHDKRNRVEVYS